MFGMLVDKYQKPFLRKAVGILHSPDMAEDAVQDTFIRIYRYAHKFSYRGGASFSSWAYKILTNTCYGYTSKKTVELEDMDVFSNGDDFLDNEQSSLVQSVLSRLPAKFSRLLSLYFFEGKNYKEIAVLENTSLGAVKSGLYRAKKQFKDIAVKLI